MNELLLPDVGATFLVGRVALTRCDNDLTKLDSVQSDYSTSISLPDAAPVRRALEHAEQGTSASTLPYRRLPAVLRLGGVEVVPRGQLLLDTHTRATGFEGRVLGGNSDFYAALGEQKLRELDLSAYDHAWTLDSIVAGARRTSGYRYDLYDRGQGVPAEDVTLHVHEAGLWPTAYVAAVWGAIFEGVGLPVPALPDMAAGLVLPATQPFGYGQDLRTQHTSAAQRTGGLGTAQRGYFTKEFTRMLVYNSVAAPFYADPAGGYSAAVGVRRIGLAGYYRLKAGLVIYLRADLGRAAAKLELLVNGQPVAQDYQSSGAALVTLAATKDRLLLQAGDTVSVRLTGTQRNSVTIGERWEYGNAMEAADAFEVELLEEFPPGGLVRLQDWLPDLSQKDFVKALIGLYGLTQRTDPYSGAVSFPPTAQVMERRAAAPDWSARIDLSQPLRRSWRVGDYAQRNYFRWKEDETSPETAKTYGNGLIPCENSTLEAEKDVLTLPFAASPTGAGGMPFLPFWQEKADFDALKLAELQKTVADTTKTAAERADARRAALALRYDTQKPQPRLLYAGSSVRPVDLTDGSSTVKDVPLPVATFTGLDFATVLLPAYYPHLIAALRRPLVLTLSVRLRAVEVVDFDQLQPVWLEGEGAWFYVNRINQFEADQPSCEVELLRLSE